ncbi:sarcosine oxidase [Pseudomonas putida CSV86]|uniref:Sarcosine oxidase n=1 Tax=Pseudomonas bharatica CSV86 TaxID=1005395 RepID=L1M743_9PSED|nr:sarcosine oxidase subunit gamma family protein [Pseudomonas bharatica]NNJ19133.1 sarcosine oxidase [Pseudomonas bharatica CSV86]
MTSLNPIERCALIDLTDLPRVGFRGLDAAQWLTASGYSLPEAPNRAVLCGDGTLVARLSQTEYFLLGSLSDRGQRLASEEAGWVLGEERNYLLPRQDSHAWLQLSGKHVAEVMAKICGVDLRAEAFPVGSVAQTSVARLNVIVINAGSAELAKFHLLCDRASLEYFQAAVLDAMGEFGGVPVALDNLLG